MAQQTETNDIALQPEPDMPVAGYPLDLRLVPDLKCHLAYTSFLDEAWFFVNGVATTDAVAELNSAYHSYIFHRPLTMIQNSTDSLLLDLLECIVGNEWYRYIVVDVKAFTPIYQALRVSIFISSLIAALLSGDFRWQWVPSRWAAALGDNPYLRVIVALVGGFLLQTGGATKYDVIVGQLLLTDGRSMVTL